MGTESEDGEDSEVDGGVGVTTMPDGSTVTMMSDGATITRRLDGAVRYQIGERAIIVPPPKRLPGWTWDNPNPNPESESAQEPPVARSSQEPAARSSKAGHAHKFFPDGYRFSGRDSIYKVFRCETCLEVRVEYVLDRSNGGLTNPAYGAVAASTVEAEAIAALGHAEETSCP